MSRKASAEAAVHIIAAMYDQRTWKQAELARACGLTTRTLRRYIDAFIAQGWPIEISHDPPHQYFALPASWFPAGVVLDGAALSAALHLLVRVPESRERRVLLKALSTKLPAQIADLLDRVIPPRSSADEERYLGALLDSLHTRQPLRMKYFSVRRGALDTRTVSVQRVQVAAPARFVAWCDRAKALRWFRVDSVQAVEVHGEAGYVEVDDDEVEQFLDGSVDGFREGEPIRVAFFVGDADARWVTRNLPDELKVIPEGDGVLIEATTAGVNRISRFVVGLGGAAECRTPELAARVRALAEGALRGARAGDAT